MSQMDLMINGVVATQRIQEKNVMTVTILMGMAALQHAKLNTSGSVWMTQVIVYGVLIAVVQNVVMELLMNLTLLLLVVCSLNNATLKHTTVTVMFIQMPAVLLARKKV